MKFLRRRSAVGDGSVTMGKPEPGQVRFKPVVSINSGPPVILMNVMLAQTNAADPIRGI
jgi:hypothetical protein